MKDIIEWIKETRKTDKGRAILFFIVFGFFFLFLAIASRISGTEPVKEYNTSYTPEVSIDKLLDNNFSYVYEIVLDDTIHVFDGKINENVEAFDYTDGTNTIKYYRSGDNYLVLSNDTWVKGNPPTSLYKFFDTKKLDKLIKKSTYDSKTDYQSGKVVYKLLISSNTINKVLDKKDTDFDEVPNDIVVSLDESNTVDEIDFTLNSYCKNNNICKKGLTIKLQYDDIGKIGAIKNPLDK